MLLRTEKKCVTFHNKCTKIPPPTQCTSQLMYENCVFVFWVYHFPLCRQQHPECERTIRLVYPTFVCKFRSSSTSTEENLRWREQQCPPDPNGCISVTIHNDRYYHVQLTSPPVYINKERINVVSWSGAV